MIIETLDEPIEVRADFTRGLIRPIAFKRNGQVWRIMKINARWEDRQGCFRRFYFSVEAGGNTFKIHLDTRDMSWRLDCVYLDG